MNNVGAGVPARAIDVSVNNVGAGVPARATLSRENS